MSTFAGARLYALIDCDLNPASPHTGDVRALLENVVSGRRFGDGATSGNANTVYYRDRDGLGAGATDSYDLLAAGALTDVFGDTVDLDELKGMLIVVDSGEIRIDAPAANFIGIFTDATDVLNIPSGSVLFDFGAAGMDVSVNSKFDITESSGGGTADYRILLFGSS